MEITYLLIHLLSTSAHNILNIPDVFLIKASLVQALMRRLRASTHRNLDKTLKPEVHLVASRTMEVRQKKRKKITTPFHANPFLAAS